MNIKNITDATYAVEQLRGVAALGDPVITGLLQIVARASTEYVSWAAALSCNHGGTRPPAGPGTHGAFVNGILDTHDRGQLDQGVERRMAAINTVTRLMAALMVQDEGKDALALFRETPKSYGFGDSPTSADRKAVATSKELEGMKSAHLPSIERIAEIVEAMQRGMGDAIAALEQTEQQLSEVLGGESDES